MKKRLPWFLWGVALMLAGTTVVFLILGIDTPPPASTWGFRGFSALFAVAFGTVGAIVASRRPENPIGWLFCGVGLLSGWQELTQQYAIYAVIARPRKFPFGEFAAWFPSWIWVPGTGLVTVFVFLLFPNGRFAGPRWRLVAWLGGAAIALTSVAFGLLEGPVENFTVIDNPFGVFGGRGFIALGNAGMGAYLLAALLASLSLVVRFRRSSGEERQQLKWFALAAVLVGITLGSSFFFEGVGPPSVREPGGIVGEAHEVAVILSFLGIPVTAGIAVLRYRLWGIDVVINRALVYGGLSAGLALAYFGLVVILQTVFRPLTRGSDLAIAATTLIVAAAFRPARERVQSLVDSRFYRRRYDAERILEAFTTRLSREVDLESLTDELRRLVGGTVQPTRVSLWVRSETGGES